MVSEPGTRSTKFLREGILTETGDLKPDLENGEDDQDQTYHQVGRNGIKAFLADMIGDEIDEYIICEVNGEQVHVGSVMDDYDEWFETRECECYPVSTRSTSKRGGIARHDI